MPFKTLRSKVLLACLVLQLVAAGATWLIQTRLHPTQTVAPVDTQASLIARVIEHSLGASGARRDKSNLQEWLDVIQQSGAVSYLRLEDANGHILAAASVRPTDLTPSSAESPDPHNPPDEVRTMLRVPAKGNPQAVHLVVGRPADASPGGHASVEQPVLLLIAAAALVSLCVTLLLASSLTRPIVKLAAAARDVAAGDLQIRLHSQRRDEVGQLSASINALAHALKARVQAFEESEQFHLQTLRQAEEESTRLSTLLNALRSGILLLDGRGQVLHASPRFLEIWQLDPLPIGTWVDDIVPALMRKVRTQDGPFLQSLKPTHSGLGVPPRELQLCDGHTVVMRMETSREGTHNTGGVVWLFEDVTKERRLQHDASRASRDPMTDLLNRRGFDEVMALAARRTTRGQTALMVIDLDDFKRANDLGGHQVGDEILVAVGRALSGLVRRTDHVARLGGDEFAVVLTDVKPHDAGVLASRMIESVSGMSFQSPAGPLRVGCSIGVALMPDPVDPKALYVQADAAMYQAKRGGKNAWFIQPASPAEALEPT